MAKYQLFKLKKSEQGQLLVEAVIAISFMVIGVLTFFGLLAQSVGYSRTISENYTATYLAAEGIEVVKNIIDANVLQGNPWNEGVPRGNYEVEFDSTNLFQAYMDRYLRIDDDGLYSYDFSGLETPFKRMVSITFNPDRPSDEIVVHSKVSWKSRGRSSVVDLEDHFFDWRE